MKILVAVKRVIDYNVQIRVKEDNSGVVTDNVKMSTNPPDDNAIEEAVKIKEAGKATEVVAVSIGEEKAQETVRKALAVGADRGILVKTEGVVEPLSVSKLLQKIVEKEKPIEQLNASDLGVDISARIEQIKVEEPPKRKAGIKVASVSELVHKLKNEAKVI